MALEGYGDFVRLPRELRDKIYGEYFAITDTDFFEPYWGRRGHTSVRIYVSSSDRGLLRASRTLYEETLPFWRKTFAGPALFRAIADVVFSTVPAKSVPKVLRPLEPKNLTSRWICQPPPRLRPGRYHAGYSRADRISIVYPNFSYFTSKRSEDWKIGNAQVESIMTSLRGNGTAGDDIIFSLVIKNASWPIKVEGEDVWYQRLHKGMTRRSLIKARQNMIRSIAQGLSRTILESRSFVGSVQLTFGDGGCGHDDSLVIDNNQDFDNIIELIQRMLSQVVTSVEIARYPPQRS